MNTAAETANRQNSLPAARPNKPDRLIVHDDSEVSYMLDTARFEHLYRVATSMAANSFIPEHIRMQGPAKSKTPRPREEVIANCFRVLNQALRWRMDPFAVIDETYEVHGRLGYQGKLVAAVVNARSNLKGGLRVTYNTKQKDEFAAVIYGSEDVIPPEASILLRRYADTEDRQALVELTELGVLAVRISVGQAKTDNQMWKTDPEQKLWYSGAVKWARRHRPEMIRGVPPDDDIDRIANSDRVILEPPSAGRHFLNVRPPEEQTAPPEPSAEESRAAEAAREAAEDLAQRVAAAGTKTQLQDAGAAALALRERHGEPWYGDFMRLYQARFAELDRPQREPGDDGPQE